jgi:hypothetical protein
VEHGLGIPINDGLPIEHNNADLVPVTGCPSLEINNTDGTALQYGTSEKQREWAQRFINIQTIAELEDHCCNMGKKTKPLAGSKYLANREP